ncbi:MAG TPA: hypothetical protein GX008_02080 [Firmicutes bacterium]|jgi:hypothetical protein|nr:MAG: hypothetical protein AA931_03190 [Peptococcaceae bacterium 1109]HHT72483.1 hypothetical protein [Bacillota bacterium]
MSIKFPDFQVLVTRTDQVNRYQRATDPDAAGRLAPQVSQEFDRRQQRIERAPTDVKVRPRKEGQEGQGRGQKKKKGSPKRGIDIRA